MELYTNGFNLKNYNGSQLQGRNNSVSQNSPHFTGGISKFKKTSADILSDICRNHEDDILSALKGADSSSLNKTREFFINAFIKGKNFIKENFIEGTHSSYKYLQETSNALKENFGDTFSDCFDDIKTYNDATSNVRSKIFGKYRAKADRTPFLKARKKFYYIEDGENLITFHKDPFLKNAFSSIREFTVGTVLDLFVFARDAYRKINARYGSESIISSPKKGKKIFSSILDKRIAEKDARDSFYKLAGVFDSIQEALDEAIKQKKLPSGKNMTDDEAIEVINECVKKLAGNSVQSASKKVGKYNTKSERAWNRLGTGFVSAIFAATDFYNISMLQNNDPEKANASGKKRFLQDMRRQGITAAITYVILGAFQKKANSSMLYAALSLGGVTLISEILSRRLGKIPLKPLNPEEAAEIAGKKKVEEKETKTSFDISQNVNAVSNNNSTSNNLDVFKIFTDKFNNNNTSVSFGASNETGNSAYNDKKAGKKSNIITKILKGFLGVIGLSLGIGILRSKNVLNIDTIIKTISKKYNNCVEELTKKRLILPKDDVDGFLNFLKRNNFVEQHKALAEQLEFAIKKGPKTGQSRIIQNSLSNKNINPDALYYDFGFVESKGKKTAANLILYPINAVSKLMQKGNNLVKTILGVNTKPAKAPDEERKMALSFIEKYANKYRDAAMKDNIDYKFRKEVEDAFSRHFSEANSQNKNTSLAMVSRFLITIISGYFFVNDYRNEVLIESGGKDIERANSTMKERIGHKIANFFLNSMFMDLFNSTFENIYLGSVAGATAVAMATEFTNESAVRASICTPTSKMNREELIEYENERLNDEGPKGKYYRTFMKITGKKPLSEKAAKK